jgi:hypothetical protein
VEQEQSKFEGWAVLEERQRVTKHYEYLDDRSLPPGSTVQEGAVQGYTKYFGPGAIYALTPCTQEAALKAVASMQSRKVSLVSLPPEAAVAALAAPSYASSDPDDPEF